MQSALLKYRLLRRHSRLCCAAILIFCCALEAFGIASTNANTEARPSEYEVKAAYLFNFTKFVKWPEPVKGDTFDICILGADPFGGALDSIVEGESVGDQKIVVRRISNAKQAVGCRIVFLGQVRGESGQAELDALPRTGILTVSDMPGFSTHGGMIQFVTEGDRIRFEINLGAAESAGLALSSELLKVAAHVIGSRG